MTNTRGQRNRRRNLMAADPHCYWCGREVREYAAPGEVIKSYPDDMATIDHLNSKIKYPDGRPHTPRSLVTVLSCWRCNECRAADEQLGIEWTQSCMKDGEMAFKLRLLAAQNSGEDFT